MIDNVSVQRALQMKGLYLGRLDGLVGPASLAAMRQAFLKAKLSGFIVGDPADWPAARLRIGFEQLMMTEEGIDVGKIDGVEGVSTQHGWEVWQNRLRGAEPGLPLPAATIGSRHPSAWPPERGAEGFYGKPGTNLIQVEPPYQLFYGARAVSKITLNRLCADSALRAMDAVLKHYGEAGIVDLGLDVFSGSFNDRPMRGGTRKSMHAYGCAIDWNAPANPLRTPLAKALFGKPEYVAFLDAWEAEGWVSLGRARNMDAMHVQAATL